MCIIDSMRTRNQDHKYSSHAVDSQIFAIFYNYQQADATCRARCRGKFEPFSRFAFIF